MRILFEANSIVPGKSGGIEYFLYSLVQAWKQYYPDDELVLHISPGTRKAYLDRVGVCRFVTDPFYRFVVGVLGSTLAGRLMLCKLKGSKFFFNSFRGMRKSWIQGIDKKVDVVIYPFQRELFVHDPRKVIFIMHDFRMFDLPGGDVITQSQQSDAITKSAFVVVSWPFPFSRLNQKFPDDTGRYFQIPFLYDSMDIAVENVVPGDFLYYPAGMTAHKNHINLIKALYVYNTNSTGKRFRLVFTGPENNTLKSELMKAVSDMGLQDDVFFLGFVSRETVFNLYKDCYAVVTPTLYEAFSGPVMEAFRFEKPVLCSNIPAHTDFLKKYNMTLNLFDPVDPENIANSIKRLADNYDYHHQLSVKGKEQLSFITPEYTVDAYHDLAVRVCESSL